MKMAGMESHPNKAMHTAETAKRIYLDLLQEEACFFADEWRTGE